MKDVVIEPEWKEALGTYFEMPAWEALAAFVREEYRNKVVFPRPTDVFRVFTLTPFSTVRVVILGQDPYHGVGQAEGL
ncbi:MAG: uracil-DNA glycosylase, partial [Rectinemataceae bacterium]|nr:uracil-DNA glycosylase [Rectinemataceae bacterium]